MSNQPSNEQVTQAQQIAEAGGRAASDGPPEQAQERAAEAMRAKRDEVGMREMSDADIDRFAAALNPKLISALEERGAFDAPPEPVRPPEQPTAPPPPNQAAEAAAAAEPAAAPRKRTLAHKFLGA